MAIRPRSFGKYIHIIIRRNGDGYFKFPGQVPVLVQRILLLLPCSSAALYRAIFHNKTLVLGKRHVTDLVRIVKNFLVHRDLFWMRTAGHIPVHITTGGNRIKVEGIKCFEWWVLFLI